MSKNDGTPVNLLALDGGGIRGICELRVLDEIMKRVQKAQNLASIPRPCDYFDLMAGTSTGGLVAILLSRFKMTTTDAIAAYYDFSGRIFSKKNRKGIMGILVGHPFHEKPLVDIIKGMVATHQIGELMIDPKPEARSKAFVCSQPAHRQGKATRFRTYEPPPPLKINTSPGVSSPSDPSSSSSLHSSSSKSASRSSASSADDSLALGPPKLNKMTSTMKDPWNDYRDVQIWEAARATTAAPSYFDPMVLTRGNNSRTFIDGAMGCNNPAKEVVDEAAALFGTDCVLGCLVSLGTGFSGEVTIGEAEGGIKKTVGLINNLKKIATNTEEVHEDLRRLIRADLDTYFRFQLPRGAEDIRLHEYKKLDELSKLMQVYIEEESSEIDKVVRILIDKAKPRGITLGQIAQSDHGQIDPPKKDIRSRPPVSEFFIGRQDIVDTLAKDLCPDKLRPDRQRRHLIYGQPGVGKSQVASKFLDVYGHCFDMILWVDAMSKETIEAGFRELTNCSEYGYAGDGSPRSLLPWLEKTEHSWILVLDDVRGDVSKYLPGGNNGAVLFTSQNKLIKPAQRWSTFVDVISEGDALELLLSRAQLANVDGKVRGEGVKLVRSLGYLPLAIEQAAATLRMMQWEVTEYAAALEIQHDDLLNKPGSNRGSASSAVLRAVHASFDVTYKILNKQAHEASDDSKAQAAKYALQLLNLFSFYHNEGLMGNILKRATTYRPNDRHQDDYGVGAESFADLLALDDSGKWIESRWQLGMDLLIAYSLVKVTKDDQVRRLYSIHGLVHNWARERTPDYLRHARAKAARLILFDSFTESQSTLNDFQYGFKVLPHVQAVMKSTEDIDSDADPMLMVPFQYKYGLLQESLGVGGILFEELFKAGRIIVDNKKALTENLLTVSESIVEAARRRGILDPALIIASNCLKGRKILHGEGHLYADRALTAYAAVHIEMGEYERAAETLRVNLRIFDAFHPGEDKLATQTALAIALFYMMQTKEARDILIDAAQEVERRYGASHPKTLETLSNLAILQITEMEYEEAEKRLKYVLEMEKKIFGPGYMGRAYTFHNLAMVYFYQDKFKIALEYFLAARSISRSYVTSCDETEKVLLNISADPAMHLGRRLAADIFT
ncbi:FabD/lysophospholipase-like protein [Daldinia decipiens]|uniref:FabD/lysophospholipase-like protein n=1 Tax=Daldinia decipiens TaxID=326647 RepID=UPI0020C5A202|nr:FabD/lysophospholipase-like protein [Daldinia decipiens]KAI1660184.1 FabD/lysophospholipase-like protein [Daldinia decipiens]